MRVLLTHFWPVFHLRINQVVFFYENFFEKHLWKSDILSKDASHWLTTWFLHNSNNGRKWVKDTTLDFPEGLNILRIWKLLQFFKHTFSAFNTSWNIFQLNWNFLNDSMWLGTNSPILDLFFIISEVAINTNKNFTRKVKI